MVEVALLTSLAALVIGVVVNSPIAQKFNDGIREAVCQVEGPECDGETWVEHERPDEPQEFAWGLPGIPAGGWEGSISPDGWALPAAGPVTSMPGNRAAPTLGASTAHAGVDIGGPCGTPIWAVQDGLVIDSGPASGFGNWIRIDHGAGLVSVYGHMYSHGLHVRVGETVKAGQMIAQIGNAGFSTGCHLHLEIHQNGQKLNPVYVLEQGGVRLG
ncbi:murein DD-endopeptidase MepM/ murein hydrolase activator NlpD [Nocardiopsis mwathae]|uniref:Murein DD-endopeptidase MepM/ murein hydrolase activator NlpD n=1 Tax=Nocardiopsis mwathae TaxID=1472723 RepID=A0A7W9YEW7_9ACTN|nr:M23 family metallopeptidase [Nocardiopsis mwathae]MBB6170655.1 murein DD-endopeptidase MepM/ murein hydrolase activator NlpD [Nocardiopsis mwathae]